MSGVPKTPMINRRWIWDTVTSPWLLVLTFYLLIGAVIFRHLLAPGLLEYGDTTFPYNDQSLSYFKTAISYVWNDHHFLGFDDTWLGINWLSFVCSVVILNFVFDDMSIVQYLWYALTFAISGISMFLLTYHLFKENSVAFIASLSYALNPWIIERIQGHLHFWQAYSFMPLLLLFYILLLDRNKFRYAIYFACISVFIIWALHYVFVAISLMLFYFLYHLLTKGCWVERKICLSSSLKLVGITMAVLGFYSLPALFSLAMGGGTAATGYSRFATPSTGLLLGQDCTVLNVIRLLGFHNSIFQSTPVPWTLLTFVIPFLWLVPVILRPRCEKTRHFMYFLYAVLVMGILLAASPTLLNGVLFKKFLYHLPLMNDPNCYVFLIAFASAPLIGLAVHLLSEKLQGLLPRRTAKVTGGRVKLIATITIALCVCLISYPLLSWQDIRYGQSLYPPEYNQLSDFLAQTDDDFRVMLLPPHLGVKHNWAPNPIAFIDTTLLPKPYYGTSTLEATYTASKDFSVLVNNTFSESNSSLQLTNVLGLANTKYIILRNDIESYPPDFIVNPQQMESYFTTLNSQQNIHLEHQFGDIYVYEISDEKFLPHVYASTNPMLILGNTERMFETVISDNFALNKPVFLMPTQVNSYQWQLAQNYSSSQEHDYSPEIAFQKLNPTKYQVSIKNALRPFFLVFSESYNTQWKAYVNVTNSQTNWLGAFCEDQITEDMHFPVNGFANAWYIDPEHWNVTGENFEITLYYKPQSILYLGWIVSGLACAGSLIYLARDWRRTRLDNNS